MKLEDYLKNNSKKYLIFDLDRTLFYLDINWEPFHQEQYLVIKSLDEKLAQKCLVARPWRPIINEFIKKHGKRASQAMIDFNRQYEEKYFSGNAKENKELTDLIRHNQNNHHFYIFSNNSGKTINTVLKKFQLADCFEKVVSRDDVTMMKPDPEGFYLIYKKNENKKNYLMVGDNERNDGVVARAAGIDFFKDLTFG